MRSPRLTHLIGIEASWSSEASNVLYGMQMQLSELVVLGRKVRTVISCSLIAREGPGPRAHRTLTWVAKQLLSFCRIRLSCIYASDISSLRLLHDPTEYPDNPLEIAILKALLRRQMVTDSQPRCPSSIPFCSRYIDLSRRIDCFHPIM